MNKLGLATAMAIVISGPSFASNDDLKMPVVRNTISVEHLTNALEGVYLDTEVPAQQTPTMQEYVTNLQVQYALSLKNYMDLADAGKDRVVTDILKPRTEIYQPCKDGMLVYKLMNTTSVMNSYLHQEVIKCFSGMKKAGIEFSGIDSEFAKNAIMAIFIKLHMPEVEQTYKAITQCQYVLQTAGVNVVMENNSPSIIVVTDEVSDEINKVVPQAAAFLSNFTDLKGDQTEVVKAFMDGLENPEFVNVTDASQLGVTNFRGVTLN